MREHAPCEDFKKFLPKGEELSSLREEDGSLKLFIANWLKELKSVKAVYREAKLPQKGNYKEDLEKIPSFEVKHSGMSPDLLVEVRLDQKDPKKPGQEEFWIALELKVCNKHLALLEAYDSILSYFIDYVALGASYKVANYEGDIPIDVFAIATNYSPLGFLFEGERKYDPDMIRGWKAYPATATYGRVLFHQRSRIRQTLDTLIQLPSHPPRGTGLLSGNIQLRRHPLPHLGVLFCDPGKGGVQLLYSDAQSGYRIHLS